MHVVCGNVEGRNRVSGVCEAADFAVVGKDLRERLMGHWINTHLGKFFLQLGVPMVFHIVVCPSE